MPIPSICFKIWRLQIILCGKLLNEKFRQNKCAERRALCSTVLCWAWSLCTWGWNWKHMQRASSKSLQSGILRQDFPYSKLKCMWGLISEEELTRVITQVIEREKSICDMEGNLHAWKKCVFAEFLSEEHQLQILGRSSGKVNYFPFLY